MHVIRARGVNEAYVLATQLITELGNTEETRYGPAMVMDTPVTTHYERPGERVLYNADRNANPFFHLFESMWILAGRNDVAWLKRFNNRIGEFSDNGEIFHGAYGHRLRRSMGIDGLDKAIEMLRKNSADRRVYVPIYDKWTDLGTDTKDVPCNVGIKFEIKGPKDSFPYRPQRLNMCVINRSNDIVWGAYGANVVQFSYIQEYVAMHLGISMGWYEQISMNWHCYLNLYEKHKLKKVAEGGYPDPYLSGEVQHQSLLQDSETAQEWDNDHREFVKEAQGINPTVDYRTNFFKYVASPMLDAWGFYENNDIVPALEAARNISATDWRKACSEWLGRRKWNAPN